MAIVLIEGFDHLSAGQLPGKGWPNTPNSMPAGRFGGQAAQWNSGGGNSEKTLPSNYAELIFGFAFKPPAYPSTNQDIARLQTGSGGPTPVIRVTIDNAGHLLIRDGAGTTVATGTTILNTGTWHYIELKVHVNGASGSCELHLDGATEIGATTYNFGSTNMDTISFPGSSGTGRIALVVDDVYVCDTSGSAPRNDFLGDVRVQTIMPVSDGAHSAWTPSTGVTHYNLVDETIANDDTDYVSDLTPGDLDTYGYGSPISAGAIVYGVQANLWARKDDANTRQIAPVVRQSSTDYVGATQTVSASYNDYTEIYNQDPTGSDWTPSTVNGDEFGVKEIA